ncbi:TPA: hypothetical protein HA251_05050 [Candidatus Woesearchaeota archaeon]|nr:hypothetical protein [Candidatus Woesearchaeota archaeon]
MQDFNLTSGEPTQVGPVQITYGARGAGLEYGSDMLTYIYAPRGGFLVAYARGVSIPARSIVRLNPGFESKFFPAEDTDLESIVFRVEDKIPAFTPEQRATMEHHGVNPVALDLEEYHNAIQHHFEDDVLVLPKFFSGGDRVPGWPCNYRKGQILQLDGAAEWTAVRAAEKAHYHLVTSEIYVGLSGSANMRYNDDALDLTAGHALLCEPGNIHCVIGITPGSSGIYSHTVAQYPPVQNDKIVVES